MKALIGQRWPLGLWLGWVLFSLSACSVGTDEELSLEPIQVPMRSDQSLEPSPIPQPEKGDTAAPAPEPGKKSASEANRKTTYLYQGQHEFDPELRGPDFLDTPPSEGASWETVHARDKDLVLAEFGIARFAAGETSRLRLDPIRYWVPQKPSWSAAEVEPLDPEFARHQKPLIFRSRSAGFASHPLGWDVLLASSFQGQEPGPEVSEEVPDTLPRRKTILLLKADDDQLDLLNGHEAINRHRYRAGK